MPESTSLPRLPSLGVLLGAIACVVGLLLLVYGSSLQNGFVRWDDGLLIYENPAVMEISPSSLKRIFTTYDPELYIPLTLFSYQVDYALAGANPFWFHAHNLFWHAAGALLVAWLAFLLTGRKWVGLFVGLLFALHPLHTEAVAWAAARKDVLSLFFFLGSLVAYLYWRDRGEKLPYRLSLLCFLLGLMSKGQILVLPVVLVLVDLYRGRRLSKDMFIEKWPWFLLSVVFGIIGIIGKTGVAASSSLGAKILMSFKSTTFYLGKMLWPDHFSLLYPYTGSVSLSSPDFYVPIFIVTTLAILSLLLRRKLPELWFGLAFYYLVLAPTFLNFAKGTEMDMYYASDRYAYVASIGIFLLVGLLSVRVSRALHDAKAVHAAGAAAGLSLILPLGALAHRQSAVWKDTESLFANVIEHFPESSHVAHNNLGNMYRLRKEMDRAVSEYEQAIAIRPHPKTMANLGGAYRQLKQYDKAEAIYARALETDARSKEAHFGYGILLAELGRRQEAETMYRTAVEIDPAYEEAYTNLGSLLLAEGRMDDAIAAYEKAVEVAPYFADAWYNLGVARSAKGDAEGAIEAYERTISVQPRASSAYINLGILYSKLNNREKAVKAFRDLLRVDPNNATAREALRQLGA